MNKQQRDIAALAAVGTGRAVLVGLDLDDPDTVRMHQGFTEGKACPDPIAACHALRRSIEDDFPTHAFTVIANERAKYLVWRARMQEILGPGEYSPREYAEARA